MSKSVPSCAMLSSVDLCWADRSVAPFSAALLRSPYSSVHAVAHAAVGAKGAFPITDVGVRFLVDLALASMVRPRRFLVRFFSTRGTITSAASLVILGESHASPSGGSKLDSRAREGREGREGRASSSRRGVWVDRR